MAFIQYPDLSFCHSKMISDGRTDGQTDQPSDKQTNRPTQFALFTYHLELLYFCIFVSLLCAFISISIIISNVTIKFFSYLMSSTIPWSMYNFVVTLWSKTTKNTDWSTGSLARPFAHSLTPLTRLLAPESSLHSHPPLCSLVRSLAHLAHSLTLLTRSLRSLPRSWDIDLSDGYFICVFFYFWP